MSRALALTDVVLRDAHQSILATRLRIDDMLPIAAKLDDVGFWSLEAWGGATFDACIRYLGEDPWDRIRQLKQAIPKTPLQMLLRGQNLLGYRHYADDVVERFVERAKTNGVDVFRIFDAMNDVRNLETSIRAVKAVEGHAQGTLSFTTSPVHTLSLWLDMAKKLEDMGCDSLCIKDMAGLLTPTRAFELISQLKNQTDLSIALHCHATTGMSTATYQKAIEAGVDVLDTAISSMSQTYGHSATETLVAITDDTDRATGYNMELLEDIASYFRDVRKKYHQFEGALKGVDSRILRAQVPGGMLTNMENQLKEQGASDKLDLVLEEIPRVREDLGYLPLVTPTSQIVGTQAVLNVLSGNAYSSMTKETEGVLRGEYGATPAPVNAELQARVLQGEAPIHCRPADCLAAEFESLKLTLLDKAEVEGLQLQTGDKLDDDVLTYALFPQIGLQFLENRGNADAFEPVPTCLHKNTTLLDKQVQQPDSVSSSTYTVNIQGETFVVQVTSGGEITQIVPSEPINLSKTADVNTVQETQMMAPLSGNIFKIMVNLDDHVKQGDVLLILEAMKMETEVRADRDGQVTQLFIKEGDAVSVGSPLIAFS